MSCSVAISSSAYRHGAALISNILVRVMASANKMANSCEDSVFVWAPTKFSLERGVGELRMVS
ncbi:MAG: hypothetical protein APF81_09795 [Desulfosporosinus sp. BRH_c37]|nr:MAG: hypothetical protein APF81_09795 [Desulfosporosinus sp. BRH_c37]